MLVVLSKSLRRLALVVLQEGVRSKDTGLAQLHLDPNQCFTSRSLVGRW